ncbi:pirin family protein [Methylotenera mobilis]|uniref:Pirin domain protein n=1 Tax=Methylotenera mobilis (strain JLW8 / ATCC BAA-1282 / DSM 17540) TaxID=583345 RepID=C6WTK6_METML|nr:pirin family protein [Methylotenera mobilis]ACT47328.1 Pirin domain protein [Methylotenera mobilis JLW8]
MLQVLKNSQRGAADHGWLQSNHSFSFGHYYNPEQMGFGPLLVINEDRVQPARGFGTHSHENMEIISYVLSGALEHKDSMGNGSVIRYGDVQRMSAGTGVSHSEFNHSSTERVHFLQIWINPNVTGIAPSYEEKHFDSASKTGQLRLIASQDGKDGSVLIHQNASIYAAILNEEHRLTHQLASNRTGYVHLIKGQVEINGIKLTTGDALKIQDETSIEFSNAVDAELLMFDLPY